MPQTAAPPHQSRSSFFAITVASALLLGLAAGGWWASSQVAMVPSAVPAYMAVEDSKHHASLSSNTHAHELRISSSGPIWREISQSQRQVLMPLRERWDSMGALAKRRWLVLADRYPQMDESERNKLVSRMNTWASLSAQQRNQARLNFESARRLSAQELQAKWDAYQALSDAEKKRLLDQANKAKAAKKSKRKLARVVKPQIDPRPSHTPTPTVESGVATPRAIPQPVIVQMQPVATPQAAPTEHLPPLQQKKPATSDAAAAAPTPHVSSQPVTVPQAAPAMHLPPLVTHLEGQPSATPRTLPDDVSGTTP